MTAFFGLYVQGRGPQPVENARSKRDEEINGTQLDSEMYAATVPKGGKGGKCSRRQRRAAAAGRAARWNGSEEESLEPPVPPGLAKLNGPLQKLAEFLWPDSKLVRVAAKESAPALAGICDKGLATWIKALPQAETDEMLIRLLQKKETNLDPTPSARKLRSWKNWPVMTRFNPVMRGRACSWIAK